MTDPDRTADRAETDRDDDGILDTVDPDVNRNRIIDAFETDTDRDGIDDRIFLGGRKWFTAFIIRLMKRQ